MSDTPTPDEGCLASGTVGAALGDSPLEILPTHVQQLLAKGHVSRTTSCLSPYRCVLTRHPIHRDATESHITLLTKSIRENGFNETLSDKSPLIAIRYSKPMAMPTRAVGGSKATVQQNWGDHPLVYVVSGASRGEAVGHLVQNEPEHPNVKGQQKGLGFFLVNSGENLTPWEVFLLSTALNSADSNSRPPNYFERTDQIAFISWELSNRKECDATFRDIAVEICFNPFLTELRQHLNLSPSVVPLYSLTDSKNSPEVLVQLIKSRSTFPYLPEGMGVIVDKIPGVPLESLDVLIDMATCVNSDRMKRVTREAAQAKQKETLEGGAGAPAKTEGFLHARAEDQLRHLFKEIVPLESASTFDVLVIRDLVGIVFGAIQECSRQFRHTVAALNNKQNGTDATCKSSDEPYSASSTAAAAYWIERIVHEASQGGLLSGLWNFPAAALVVLFYIYFVNRIQDFDKTTIQENILKWGTVLYRCIAELALTLRSYKVTLTSCPVALQVRVFEAASLLFRFALFGTVKAQMFPSHPTVISPSSVAHNAQSIYEIKTFTQIDELYEFLYSHWFQGIITTRLSPTMDYRKLQPSVTQRQLSHADSTRKRNWFDARRLDVAATANRLRQEVEAMMNSGSTPSGVERVRVKRFGGKRSAPCGSERLPDSVEVEVLDPSILPMAQPARLEFLSLVFGVTSMLIEKQQGLESSATCRPNSQTQILTVPANMIVLAAIKVALSLIPPHFDRLAPFLVHWIDVRCRLIVWMWKTCKQELCRRAEEKWAEHWARLHFQQPNAAPRLDIRFTSHRQDGRPVTELTLTKLAEVVPEILPNVLQSMTQFYEEKTDLSDDKVIREFFARWLKTTGEGDLIAQVNHLLSRPSPSSSSIGMAEHTAKRARHERPEGFTSDYLRSTPLGHLPLGVAPSHPPEFGMTSGRPNTLMIAGSQSMGSRMVPSADDRVAKRARKPIANRGSLSEGDELGDWLESLPFTDKVRLDALEVPHWKLPVLLKASPPDVLRWRPPELLHPFSGNGLRAPPFDAIESLQDRNGTQYQPISDFDWKVTKGVLKLLTSRGIDTLVSRGRGEIFFLDQVFKYHDVVKSQSERMDSDREADEGKERQRLIKKPVVKKSALDTAAQKRYGASFFKSGDPLCDSNDDDVLQRVHEIDSIRDFLEFSSPRVVDDL